VEEKYKYLTYILFSSIPKKLFLILFLSHAGHLRAHVRRKKYRTNSAHQQIPVRRAGMSNDKTFLRRTVQRPEINQYSWQNIFSSSFDWFPLENCKPNGINFRYWNRWRTICKFFFENIQNINFILFFLQFSDIVDFSEEMASKGKVVIVAGLITTFERKPFFPMIELLSKAEKIDKLNAVCLVCKTEDASFTMRHSKISPTENFVGGAESYTAVCRKCHPCK